MTSDQIDVARGAPGPLPDGSQGWGFSVGVQVRRSGLGPAIGSYGWAGGMGSMWTNDPGNELIGVMLTTDAFCRLVPRRRGHPGLLDRRVHCARH
jgi:CubicO group peptidase (beta-lactamase class C family)